MAEFCPDCFLEFNPELTKNDLVIVEDVDLCEGCGKIVHEIVLYVKKTPSNKSKKTNTKVCLSCSNGFSEECPDGDILHCMLGNGKIVKEDNCCEDWN